MIKKLYHLFIISACISASTGLNASVTDAGKPALSIEPVDLRCEYLTSPLGMDVAEPRLTWRLQDDRAGALQQAYRIVAGEDSLAVLEGKGSYWDTQKIDSDDMLAVYQGQNFEPYTRYFWRVEIWDKDGVQRHSAVASFETGHLRQTNWKGYWISDGHTTSGNSIRTKPAPYLRKEFRTETGKIRSARAYIAAAGLYELYINGQKTGDHRLDPMFTRYDRRNLYVAYDVTAQLQQGDNAVGVLLGNGWYNHQSTAVWYFHRAPWRDRPTFCLDLRITYEDGSTQTVISDRDWKTSSGSLIFNSIYTGEHYDARLEQQGWNTAGFDASKWKNALYRPTPSSNIVAQQLHPVRDVELIPTRVFKKLSDRRYIFDLGRNISGVTRLRVSGEAGTEIRLVHSEILRPNDSVDIRNIAEHYRPTDDTDPFSTDIYILSGKGEDVFMPRFNYKGFQYVEVTADKPVELTSESLEGLFMHSDVPPAGQVETSNPLLNRIWFAANNSYLSNLFGYATDCPHREKNGWTGDGNYAVDLGLFNFDGITVYEKWMADHRDEQQPNGLIPNIIPTSGWGYDWATGPEWTGSVAIIPWAVYEFYGDSRLLASMYDNIKRYVGYLESKSPGGLCNNGLGDWIPVKSQTPQQYTTTVYYYRVVTILARTAKLFNNEEDYSYYTSLAAKIKDAFNKEYLDREKAIYHDGNQTELSTALLWGLAPDELRPQIAANLAKRITTTDNNHIDVGLLGSKSIFYALTQNGYADIAYTIASQSDYPSIGYWIAKDNATTLYEFWNAIGEVRENSLNHIMFGEISAWFYKALGGINIDPEHPGFKNILLRPHFVKGLTYAKVSYNSPRGKIVSHWERKKGKITYHIVIPANSTALLTLPAGSNLKKALFNDSKTIELTSLPDGSYNLPAGNYSLEITQ
ncbi:MAG: glycoside hydrolase family 78 protein [Tannerella sp.]|jgi:alpha-L-rhamnosidase|nr:glycoside hydrolase family 78 protein [Tannerella sp.]